MANANTKKTDADVEAALETIEDEEVDQEAELAKIALEAQENPDLYAFLTEEPQPDGDGGPKGATVLLFLGDEKPYVQAKQEFDSLTFRRTKLGNDLETGENMEDLTEEEILGFRKMLEDLDAELPGFEEKVKATKAKLFSRKLIVKLTTPPTGRVKIAERRARKASPGRRNNEEAAFRYNAVATLEVLARAMTSVELPDGREVLGKKPLATAKMLENLLPPSQWVKLKNEMDDLVYVDKITDIAIADPGFLAES